MKVSTQNVLLLLWTVICTALLFCMAVLHTPQKMADTFSIGQLPTSEATQRLLSATGSGSIQSIVSNELAYMHTLLTHTEKGLLFSEYMYNFTEDAEVKFLADNLRRRFRYTSLSLRKWLRDWYNEDDSILPLVSVPLSDDATPPAKHALFFAFMLRHNPWEAALTKEALKKGIRQDLAEHVLKNAQVSALELDVLKHLSRK